MIFAMPERGPDVARSLDFSEEDRYKGIYVKLPSVNGGKLLALNKSK